MKNPIIAALLNIIPGLGYVYVGHRRVFGVVILIFLVIVIVTQNAYDTFLYTRFAEEDIAIPMESDLGRLYSLTIAMIPVLIGAFMYDAYKDAKSWNTQGSKGHKHLSSGK